MRKYNQLNLSVIRVEGCGAILTGSVTNVPISINKVEVQPLENGFEGETDGFKSLSFD